MISNKATDLQLTVCISCCYVVTPPPSSSSLVFRASFFFFSSHCCSTIHLTFAEDALFFFLHPSYYSPHIKSVLICHDRKYSLYHHSSQPLSQFADYPFLIVVWLFALSRVHITEDTQVFLSRLFVSKQSSVVSKVFQTTTWHKLMAMNLADESFSFFFFGLAKWWLYWSVSMHTVGRIHHTVYSV